MPQTVFGKRCFHANFFFRHRMDKTNAARMQADAAIRIAARGTIFQVTFYRAADFGQLTTDLMMAPGLQIHFQQIIMFCFSLRTNQ